MKQNEFINLLSNPANAGSNDLASLQELKKQFPFFHSAHMLLTLVSRKYDSGLYQQTLKQTAISIPNRARLHSLLNEFVSKPSIEIKDEVKNETIQPIIDTKKEAKEKVSEIDHLKAIELSAEAKEEELNKLVEKEIQKDIITAFVEKEVLKTPDWYKKQEATHDKEPITHLTESKKEEEAPQISSGSFSDWLQALKKADRVEEKPVTKDKSEEEKLEKKLKTEVKPIAEKDKIEKKAKQQSIIDKIIEVNPSTIRLDPNQRFFAADTKAKESLIENEELVTETLAKIYALQGNISKAVRAYEILSLKFPQKSAYFATLIQNLKKQNQ
ncbi:MAG: hypothetical protein J0L69_06985 [Bacteroidetes bacterium]|nr:hypothetical protein [Bacteroidota bacterium]